MAQGRENSEINIDEILGNDVNQPQGEPTPPVNEPTQNIEEEINRDNQPNRDGWFHSFWQNVQSSWTTFVNFVARVKHSFEKKHKCPYCFDEVNKRNTRDLNREVGGHIRNSNRGTGESTRRVTQIPFCNSCGNDIPTDYFNSKSKNIAVIGGVSSGKSTFITVLIDLLLNHKSLVSDLGLHSMIIDNKGREIFDKNKGVLIESLKSLEGTQDRLHPILVRINSNKKENSESLFLSLFDTQGEEFKSVIGILNRCRQVTNADAILFLLNPLDIRGVFRQLKKADKDGIYKNFRENDDNYEIIQNIHDAFVEDELLKSGQPIKLPVAFGISRADEIEEIANIYLSEDNEEEYFDINDMKSDLVFSSEDLMDFLDDEDPRLVANIRQNYSNFKFFPVSSMGNRPKDEGTTYSEKTYSAYEPKGVLNPILWLLSELKFI
jgi:hypothetical protein